MNLLHPHPERRFPAELALAVFERGAAIGRSYIIWPTTCGEGPDAIHAADIRIVEERMGTSFHASTPFLCRGKIIHCCADFYEAEFERPIQPEDIGAEYEPVPPRNGCPWGPRE